LRDFRKLKVWQKAHRLVLGVYKATAPFPRAEYYDGCRQLRRAAGSIPANIPEGCGRTGSTERARFLSIALRSASELEYHLLLARDVKALAKAEHERLDGDVTEVKRMLTSLIQKLTALTYINNTTGRQNLLWLRLVRVGLTCRLGGSRPEILYCASHRRSASAARLVIQM
jgi:four helix bundle protein